MKVVFDVYIGIVITLLILGMGSIDSNSTISIILITIGTMMLAIPCYLANRPKKSSDTDYQSHITTLS